MKGTLHSHLLLRYAARPFVPPCTRR
jgi:hypothetical protein